MPPADLKYRKSHEWVRVNGNVGTVGITDFAIKALTDLVYIQFNRDIGDKIAEGDPIGEVESVKTVSDIYTPISGEIIEINKKVSQQLDILSSDPFGEGWLFKVKFDEPKEIDALLTPEEYEKHVESEAH